jgi:glycosyltransferase involved in cell wall biosynthesis
MYSIIIPTWNNLTFLKKCIESIIKYSEFKHEIVVHVNEGKDDTIPFLEENRIPFSYTETNVGVCKAVNMAFEKTTKGKIVYFNDDMVALPLWDTEMNKFEETYLRGKGDKVWVSSTMIEPTGHNPCCLAPHNYGRDVVSFDEKKILEDINHLRTLKKNMNGSTWPPNMMHRSMFEKIGGFDEDYFPGFGSDPDIAMKLWKEGVRDFVGVGTSLVYHFVSKSTQKVPNNGSGKKIFQRKHGMTIEDFVGNILKRGSVYEKS